MKISNKKKSYIELAKNVALQSNHKVHKHGALLIKGGKIINTSPNKVSYNSFASRFTKFWPTLHAEIGAVLGIDRSVTIGADIWVIRVNKLGKLRNSKPCRVCMEVLKSCGIRRVYYSNGKEEIEKLTMG